MSETQRTRESSTRRSPGARDSPYPRENYFASVTEEYDPEREPLDETRNDHHLQALDRGTSKDEWIVATLQRGLTEMLCPYALNESPNRGVEPLFAYLFEEETVEHDPRSLHHDCEEVELPGPSVYPPQARHGASETDTAARKPSTSRWRVNPEHGYLVFGGIPRDQPTEEFLAFVDELIEAIETDPLDSECEAALELARELKTRGDRSDSDICELIVQKLLGSDSICEFVATGNY